MSREIKPQIYYLCRRGWYDQLLAFCDGIIKKKGKDPATMYWRAFAMGMTGNVSDCLRTLESFQSRKDMSYAVNLALMHFHKRAPQQDREAISMLRGEQSVAEDVTVRLVVEADIIVSTCAFIAPSIWFVLLI